MADRNGKRHEVRIEKTHHCGMTGRGELLARCLCGWWDTQNFLPRGEQYAALRLQYSATDHVPR